MRLRVDPGGLVTCVYGEAIDLAALGSLTIRRASHVEPDDQGHWWADLAPVGAARLGPFGWRSEALRAAAAWLDEHLARVRPAPRTSPPLRPPALPAPPPESDTPSAPPFPQPEEPMTSDPAAGRARSRTLQFLADPEGWPW